MRALASVPPELVCVQRLEEMLVFVFREQVNEGAYRACQERSPLPGLLPGLYRVRRFLTTDPAADLGEMLLEISPCTHAAPRGGVTTDCPDE